MPTSRVTIRRAPAMVALVLALCGAMPWRAAAGDDRAAASPYKLVLPAAAGVSNLDQYRLAPARGGPAPAFAEKPFAREIAAAARNADLDPALLHALIHVESRHQAHALSPKGATGLMQVMPDTGARFGVPHPERSVEANLKAGSLYLRSLMRQFDGRLDLTLAAYNAGEGAVLRHARAIPPYPETRAYVPAVMAKYAEWRDNPGVARQIEYLPGTRLGPFNW